MHLMLCCCRNAAVFKAPPFVAYCLHAIHLRPLLHQRMFLISDKFGLTMGQARLKYKHANKSRGRDSQSSNLSNFCASGPGHMIKAWLWEARDAGLGSIANKTPLMRFQLTG